VDGGLWMIFDVSAFFFSFRFTTMNLHLFNDEKKKKQKNREKYKPYSVCDFHHDSSK